MENNCVPFRNIAKKLTETLEIEKKKLNSVTDANWINLASNFLTNLTSLEFSNFFLTADIFPRFYFFSFLNGLLDISSIKFIYGHVGLRYKNGNSNGMRIVPKCRKRIFFYKKVIISELIRPTPQL